MLNQYESNSMNINKSILMVGATFAAISLVSAQAKPDKHWYHEKPSKKNMGISLNEAYSKGIPSQKTIVVAVIDGGTDINHPDLKNVIWHNPGEIPFNNIDDDKNGYVDDTVGWNFIGGADGKMVGKDNLEATRVYKKLNDKFKGMDDEQISAQPEGALYNKLKSDIGMKSAMYKSIFNTYKELDQKWSDIALKTGNINPTVAEIEAITVSAEDEKFKTSLLKAMKKTGSFLSLKKELKSGLEQLDGMANYQYSLDFDTRTIVGDNYADSRERYYGNNNVMGPDASHGTHVAGIIGAVRGNNIGLDGVADNVRIMVVRVVPDGDERDKDVANGILYAVENGANIINMSFGKGYKWDKEVVNDAVKFAESKGVLLVHAAGNSNLDIDKEPNYPNDSLGNATFAKNWIEVGASQPKAKILATDFSNYGKNNVDLFSPGQDIYSTIPNNEYAYFNGTSMAAPVCAGVAAFVWSRYPTLTAEQVKHVLESSTNKMKPSAKVKLPGSKESVLFTDLSKTGGLLNAYRALIQADNCKYTGCK